MLLDLNLQLFAEGEDDNLDLDSMLAEFEAEWEDETEGLESEESEGLESESDPEPEEQQEEESEQEETPDPNDDDAEKRNRAFADLRRQADENRKYAEFIQALAQEGGVKPDEILARYQERQLTEQAKTIDPVELLRQQNSTSMELAQLKDQMRAERMNTQIENVVGKYSADDNAIRETFEYMAQTGIDPRTADNVDFEKFYRAAHLDTIIQKEVENAKQKDLEDKKKRQTNASIGNGTSVSPSSGELSDEDFEAELARLDIKI